MDHATKLKFSSYVHLPSVNKIFQFRAWVLISALKHIRMLLLSCRYVLQACINTIYKYGHAWVS